MYTYQVRLSPKPGTGGRNLTTEVRANSDTEARLLAESQNPNHRIEAIHRLGS
jgi:hypothetical protein